MAVIYPPRGQSKAVSRSMPIAPSIPKITLTTPRSTMSTIFQMDMGDGHPSTIPVNTGWHTDSSISGRGSVRSQAIEPTSDLASSAPAIETDSNHSPSARSGVSKALSSCSGQSAGNNSINSFLGSGIELVYDKRSKKTTPDANNTLIRRRGSTRLEPNEYRPLMPAATDFDDAEASQACIAMLQDWIQFHDFKKGSSVEAVSLVNWSKVHPLERQLAAHSANHRARSALKDYVSLKEESPTPQQDHEVVNLKSFADAASGDTNIEHVMDIDDLDFMSAHFDNDLQLPRTIVVLAKVYHRIRELNLQLEKEAQQWMLFLRWLTPNNVIRQPEARQLERISDRILKEGACHIRKSIADLLKEYETLRRSTYDRFQKWIPDLDERKDKVFVGIPEGYSDICELTPTQLRELVLKPGKAGKEGSREKFLISLAFRGSTLIELRLRVIKARGSARTGEIDSDPESIDSD